MKDEADAAAALKAKQDADALQAKHDTAVINMVRVALGQGATTDAYGGTASSEPLITKRMTLEKIASIFGIENVDAALEQIEDEKAENELQAKQEAEAAAAKKAKEEAEFAALVAEEEAEKEAAAKAAADATNGAAAAGVVDPAGSPPAPPADAKAPASQDDVKTAPDAAPAPVVPGNTPAS